ncbi:MAG: response regulator transcription factor [Mariprofundales bacterium]|nr:response regulator transcription factor [Mariprofundales bacterium]
MIFVVDDNASIREMLDAILSAEGYDVSSAEGGEAAIIQLKQRIAQGQPLPQLVLQDLTMPYKTGYQTMAEMRTLPGFDAVPVVIISAFPEDEERPRALAAGAADYLCKPFKIPDLLDVVAHYVPGVVDGL